MVTGTSSVRLDNVSFAVVAEFELGGVLHTDFAPYNKEHLRAAIESRLLEGRVSPTLFADAAGAILSRMLDAIPILHDPDGSHEALSAEHAEEPQPAAADGVVSPGVREHDGVAATVDVARRRARLATVARSWLSEARRSSDEQARYHLSHPQILFKDGRGGLIDEWLAAMVAIETPHTPQYRPSKPAAVHEAHQTPSALHDLDTRVPQPSQHRQSEHTQYAIPSHAEMLSSCAAFAFAACSSCAARSSSRLFWAALRSPSIFATSDSSLTLKSPIAATFVSSSARLRCCWRTCTTLARCTRRYSTSSSAA